MESECSIAVLVTWYTNTMVIKMGLVQIILFRRILATAAVGVRKVEVRDLRDGHRQLIWSELRSRVPVPTGSAVPTRQEDQAQQAESEHRPK